MAFESLSDRLSEAFKKIAGKDKITEKNIESSLQEVRKAFLEADVNYRVAKDFLEKVTQQALGEKVLKSVNPQEMIIKIIHDELVSLLGDEQQSLVFKESGLTTMMIVGLQGTGKTTNLAKIANYLKQKENKNILIIAADVIRPAAIEQLQTLGKQIGIEVFSQGPETAALTTVQAGMDYAKANGFDTVLIDTAGRLHIDEALMAELKDIKDTVSPTEILLTVDAMTGQDIIQVAQSFNDLLQVTGLVVTKLDGDARGGAVLSVRAMTGVPVKFTGTGEKIEDLDFFYPDRMADRIMGMGDVVSLVEKAQEKMDMEAAERSAARMMEGKFDLNDMLTQFEQVSKMGSLMSIMKMIPGLNKLAKDVDGNQAEAAMKRNKAIIQSMTKEERENPDILRASRKNRIAKGSGTTPSDVNRLLKQYEQMKEQMRMMSRLMKK